VATRTIARHATGVGAYSGIGMAVKNISAALVLLLYKTVVRVTSARRGRKGGGGHILCHQCILLAMQHGNSLKEKYERKKTSTRTITLAGSSSLSQLLCLACLLLLMLFCYFIVFLLGHY